MAFALFCLSKCSLGLQRYLLRQVEDKFYFKLFLKNHFNDRLNAAINNLGPASKSRSIMDQLIN